MRHVHEQGVPPDGRERRRAQRLREGGVVRHRRDGARGPGHVTRFTVLLKMREIDAKCMHTGFQSVLGSS